MNSIFQHWWPDWVIMWIAGSALFIVVWQWIRDTGPEDSRSDYDYDE